MNADKSTASGSRSIRADILRMLRLPADASDEELYRVVLGEGSDLRATGTAGPSDARRINSAGYGASRVGVIGAALSRESRRLVACGAAPDMLSAQRLAVARNPDLLRR